MQVQVELANLLPGGRFQYRVEADVVVSHAGVVHPLKGEHQQVLLDTEQPLRHHLGKEIFDQLVLVHGKLHLLHLVHVVGQVPGVDLSIKGLSPHGTVPLLQGQNILPFLDSHRLQFRIELICEVGDMENISKLSE